MAPPRKTDWTGIGYSTQLLTQSSDPMPFGVKLLTVTGHIVELRQLSVGSSLPRLDHFYTWQVVNDLPALTQSEGLEGQTIVEQSVRLIHIDCDLEAFRMALLVGIPSVYLPCPHERYESTGFTIDQDEFLIERRVCQDCHEAHEHRYPYGEPIPWEYLVYMLGLARDWACGFIRIAELAISQYDQLERFKDKPGDKAPAQLERTRPTNTGSRRI